MSPKRLAQLLDRIGCVSHACDLDLLLFFYRHPRVILTSERLALYVGYDLPRVAKSLEALIAAGLLTRAEEPKGGAQMYLLVGEGPTGGWTEALLRRASTRQGRLEVIAAIAERQRPTESANPGVPESRVGNSPRSGRPGRDVLEVGYA
jgi:hypothetical protein